MSIAAAPPSASALPEEAMLARTTEKSDTKERSRAGVPFGESTFPEALFLPHRKQDQDISRPLADSLEHAEPAEGTERKKTNRQSEAMM